MLLPGPDLHCAGLLALWRFLPHFSTDIDENQKKSQHVAGTVPYYGKSGHGKCITFTKKLDEGLRWQLLRQNSI